MGLAVMSAIEIALNLIARSIAPIPVPHGQKNPIIKGWPQLSITAENAAHYFNGTAINVGAIMGPRSNGLTDVDLDCNETVRLARHFLPQTHSIYGRVGKRRSHYLFRCSDPAPKAKIKFGDETKLTIVELRLGGGSKGAQSIWPGSVHPTGEIYEWDEDGEPASASCATLKAACVKIAFGAILMRHIPPEGPTSQRHDIFLGIGGFLARAGWTTDEIEHLVETVCSETDGAEYAGDHARTARESAEAFESGTETRGYPWLVETFDEPIAKALAKIVDYRTRGEAREPQARDNRPAIKVEKGKLSNTANLAENVLIAAGVEFYERSNALVRPIIKSVESFRGRKTTTAQLASVDQTYMRDVLSRVANWYRLDQRSNAWIDDDPPHDIAATVLSRAGEWKFPTVAGIITTQTMRPDGTILSQPGDAPIADRSAADAVNIRLAHERRCCCSARIARGFARGIQLRRRYCKGGGALDVDHAGSARWIPSGAHARCRCAGGVFWKELLVRHRIRHRHRAAHAGDRCRSHRGRNGKAPRQRIDRRSAIDRDRQRQW
jgi:hypothetical protein